MGMLVWIIIKGKKNYICADFWYVTKGQPVFGV
jgi:hypothetical protein